MPSVWRYTRAAVEWVCSEVGTPGIHEQQHDRGGVTDLQSDPLRRRRHERITWGFTIGSSRMRRVRARTRSPTDNASGQDHTQTVIYGAGTCHGGRGTDARGSHRMLSFNRLKDMFPAARRKVKMVCRWRRRRSWYIPWYTAIWLGSSFVVYTVRLHIYHHGNCTLRHHRGVSNGRNYIELPITSFTYHRVTMTLTRIYTIEWTS